MSHLFWLDEEHLKRIGHMFPKPRGVKRADDRRVLSGIIHIGLFDSIFSVAAARRDGALKMLCTGPISSGSATKQGKS